MLERLLLTAIVVGTIALAIALTRRLFAIRNHRILARIRADRHNSPHESTSTPKIIYFTTTTCVVCRVQQQPALEELLAKLPELEINKYDAVKERELAGQYGVLSVPTTAVYDRQGELVSINRGFAPTAVLYSQATGAKLMLEGGKEMAAEQVDQP
jgi:thiol-disulfide isomerase/thioredoxin